jgi:hypothetical protein
MITITVKETFKTSIDTTDKPLVYAFPIYEAHHFMRMYFLN